MRLITVIIIGLMLLAFTPAALAQLYFDPDDDVANWEEQVWSLGGCVNGGDNPPPLSTQSAVICPGKDCTMTQSHEIVSVDVRSNAQDGDGILRITSGKTLTLNGNGNTSDIDGIIYVTGGLELDWTDPQDATHTFTGDGEINGTATGAAMLIEGYDDNQHMPVVTNSTTISGVLHIYESNAELVMLKLDSGTIDADGNGDLKIELGLMDDAGTSHFKVGDDTNARLYLDVPGACSGGIQCYSVCFEYTDVEILKGRFTFVNNFATEQPLYMGEGGRIALSTQVAGYFDAPSNECNQ